MWRQARWDEPLILCYSSRKSSGYRVPYEDEFSDLYESVINEMKELGIYRERIGIPNLSELVVMRHFTRLSHMAYGVDVGTTPLGSCTMKYNPRICNEALRRLSIEDVHPEDLDDYVQGLLRLLHELELWLAEITGMDRCSLQVPAGAAGELAGALMIRKYFEDRGELRDEMIVPDNAHGTNPASAAMAGFRVVKVPTSSKGTLDIDALRAVLSKRTAGIMLTNPNTLGIFEDEILEIAQILHDNGSLLYYDGANINAILGIARPGDMGFDLVHLNLHKTFATPHGGGGPGGAAICAKGELVDYLPRPLLNCDEERCYWDYSCDKCIGAMRAYYGNIPALIRAYAYIAMLGPRGLRRVAEVCVLNSNYFIKKLYSVQKEKLVVLTHDASKPRKHEFVVSAKPLRDKTGINADDLAKCLEDQGIHPPIIYFPLIVEEALMIELTETEPITDIERYVQALAKCIDKAVQTPEEFKKMPQNTSVKRLDLVRANHPKTMVLSHKFGDVCKE